MDKGGGMLSDGFGRIHDYLRISITDQCNFSCSYCKPASYVSKGRKEYMTPSEIEKIAKVFAGLGVKKIRLTGGEPLIRKDFAEIVKRLAKLEKELTLTTNGYFLDKHIPLLKETGVHSLNISLDSLKAERFKAVTGNSRFKKVLNNILCCLEAGFHVKINAVVIRGVNDDEIEDFIDLTKDLPLHVRFIELMPFAGNGWKNTLLYPYKEMLEKVSAKFPFVKLPDGPNDTCKKYFIDGHKGTFAFISSMTEEFCGSCNRLRLTSDGKLKNCLFSKSETDLLSALRDGKDIEALIRQSVTEKAWSRGGQFDSMAGLSPDKLINRNMVAIGG